MNFPKDIDTLRCMPDLLHSFAKSILYVALKAWRSRTFWIRAGLCWCVGAALIFNEESSNFDLRFQIRGPRPTTAKIVIVDISERDWADFNPDNRNILRPLKEVMSFTDSFFWSTPAWKRLLTRLLSAQPAAVGVTFFFGENIHLPYLSGDTRELFEDDRIVWGADIDSAGRVLIPSFASAYNANVGVRTIHADDDGNVRRFTAAPLYFPSLPLRVAQLAEPKNVSSSRGYQSSTLINYRGGASSFRVVSFSDVIANRIAPETLRNAVILVGNLGSPAEQMQTPLGRMSRVEVIANIVDNVMAHRVVHRAPDWVYLLLLIGLMAGSLSVLSIYPQSVALVFFTMAGMLWAAASCWLFDTLYFWLPVLAPVTQLTVTYIVFLSFQLSLNEQRAWRLEQEQRFALETEQLKTNFVSMMSHDLKTPIAKIQAICDRLLATAREAALEQDLKTLRRSSDDLHRYIQSILQVTKIEAKDFKITLEVTDINENVERVIGRLMPLAHERQIRLETRLEPMFSIEADTNLLQEVIHNLIENAIKYTPAGGQVIVRSEEKDDNVVVVVEDTGPGIALEEQTAIWEKFTRGRGQALESKGTGLGLYLVKYFVELHGGKVFLESLPQEGTKIGFTLPAV